MDLLNRINAFAKLGDILMKPDETHFRSFAGEIIELKRLINESRHYNGWFTPENVKMAVSAIGNSLTRPRLEKWMGSYDRDKLEDFNYSTVGVVMAGNIPLVGFHDFLSVLITGNAITAKLSSDDNKLLPLVAKMLIRIEPDFSDRILFTDAKLEHIDAIIATGSTNTSRYFEYYFGKYPHIIRKNRNGVAVITGNETDDELLKLGDDIFSYFGLGCRNVSKLYVPEKYAVENLYKYLDDFVDIINHHKYCNNYDYNKSIYLVNGINHLDNGFLILKEDEGLSSPISVLFYERYDSISKLQNSLDAISDRIQCVVTSNEKVHKGIPPGTSQSPQLWDYADGVDTIGFLLNLPDSDEKK